MTTQQQIQAKLEQIGLPYSEIKCYGSQITIECGSDEAGRKWAGVLSRFATVKGMIESIAYNKVNRGTYLRPTTHKIWRVYATL